MKIIYGVMAAVCLSVGCADISPRDNVSPKLQQDIQNQNGRIDRIENNQNSIRSQIDEISLIHKENSGVQILQGDGALILVFALAALVAVCIYFYRVGASYQKVAEMLAEEINSHDDPNLEEKVLKAAQHTAVESRVLSLIRKRGVEKPG
jgi:hypothetical protein